MENNIQTEFSLYKGVGLIDFSYTEADVLKLFGPPTRKQYYDKKQVFLLEYIFQNEILNIFFHHRKKALSYLSIHCLNLIVDGINISTLSQTSLLKHLKKYHKNNNLKFKYSYEESPIDIFFDFSGIGITVWYEKGEMSDISIVQSLPPAKYPK